MNRHFYYRGFTRYIFRLIEATIGMLFFIRLKEKKTIQYIKDLIGNNDIECLMLRSGRSCLRYVFLNTHKTVLLPDYTCNVVEKAAEGHRVDFYHVDEHYRYSLEEVLNYIKNKPDCTVVISSYLNRSNNWNEIIKRIRGISTECVIVFDECQNSLNLNSMVPVLDNVFYILSFNNKMSLGFLGGMIIGKKLHQHSIKKNKISDEIHAIYAFIKYVIYDIKNAKHSMFSMPKIETSDCKGIYSCDVVKPLRISISLAYLAMKHKEESISRLLDNYTVLTNEPIINEMIIDGSNERTMPYLPAKIPADFYGLLPVKGPYGGLTHTKEQIGNCLVLHNVLELMARGEEKNG